MRKYIRHPSDIPIEYKVKLGASSHMECLTNVSLGGLAFITPEFIEPGGVILVKIPFVSPPFEAYAKVVWCIEHTETMYEVGTELLNQEDAFRARMIEQVCHIEQYKREVASKEGRQLSGEEAAREWIEQFAADFPRIEELDA